MNDKARIAELEAQLREAQDEIARLRFGKNGQRVLPNGYSEIMTMPNGQEIRVSFPNGHNL